MSRFLDRLIAGARGPVSNVRPVVRPVFLETGRLDAPVEESRELSSPAPASRVSAQTPVAPAARSAELSEDSHSPAQQKAAHGSQTTLSAEREIYRPLILETRHVERLVERHTADNRNEAPPRNLAETPPAAADRRPHAATDLSVRTPFDKNARLSERVAQIETRSAPQPLPLQRIPAAKPSTSAQDQIEIQIGRIEIIAAPPAAPPLAPPRRPRSSVSLTEYLKRGERV